MCPLFRVTASSLSVLSHGKLHSHSECEIKISSVVSQFVLISATAAGLDGRQFVNELFVVDVDVVNQFVSKQTHHCVDIVVGQTFSERRQSGP